VLQLSSPEQQIADNIFACSLGDYLFNYKLSWLHLFFCSVQKICRAVSHFSLCAQVAILSSTALLSASVLNEEMPQLSAETKHHILLEYSPYSRSHSFAALAAKHRVEGGWRTVQRWHAQWNGSPASLQHRKGAGRPRLLSRAEISRHIRAPLLASNRSHKPVHYTELLPKVQQKTGKELAIRTLRLYGAEVLKAKQKHTIKRTAQESKQKHTTEFLLLLSSFYCAFANLYSVC
jgi:hypothetical protein